MIIENSRGYKVEGALKQKYCTKCRNEDDHELFVQKEFNLGLSGYLKSIN